MAVCNFFSFCAFCQVSRVTLETKKIPVPMVRDSIVDNWNRKSPEFGLISNAQKEMLYWTNYSRINPRRFWDSVVFPILTVFPQLNRDEAKTLKAELTSKVSLPLFTINPILTATSQSHATDIASNNLGLSHSSSSGKDFSTRMRQAGIQRCAAENIAMANDNILLALAFLYLDVGLKEAGHRKALLNPMFSEIGIGSSFSAEGQLFLVQDFSCPQN